MGAIEEKYQRIADDKRSFDIRFWQSQGDRAIFEAVSMPATPAASVTGIPAAIAPESLYEKVRIPV